MTATHDLDQAAQYFDRIMLLNQHLIKFGSSKEVLTAENLKLAYGSRLRFVEDSQSLIALDNSCCDGGDE